MAQELVAHPVSGKPAIKVIHFTPEGEKIDYEVRELKVLQEALDHAYEEAKAATEHTAEVKRQADKMLKEAQMLQDEAETRLDDCKSELKRGEDITEHPGVDLGPAPTSRPRPIDILEQAGSGFGIPR